MSENISHTQLNDNSLKLEIKQGSTPEKMEDKVSDVKYITNDDLTLKKTIRNNLSIFRTDEDMKKLFPSNSLTVQCRKEKKYSGNFISLFSPKFNKLKVVISSCSSCNKCDIWKNYLASDTKLNVRLLVECTMLETACLATALMFFTLFLVTILETSMLVQLLISSLDLESTKVAF